LNPFCHSRGGIITLLDLPEGFFYAGSDFRGFSRSFATPGLLGAILSKTASATSVSFVGVAKDLGHRTYGNGPHPDQSIDARPRTTALDASSSAPKPRPPPADFYQGNRDGIFITAAQIHNARFRAGIAGLAADPNSPRLLTAPFAPQVFNRQGKRVTVSFAAGDKP